MLSWDRRDSLLGMMRDALFPRGCAGCDRPDEVLCGDCRSLFANWRNRELVSGQETQGAVHTWSASTYQGVVRHAILAWKDHDDTELDTIFGEVMASLLEHSAIHRSCRRQTAVLVVRYLHRRLRCGAEGDGISIRYPRPWQTHYAITASMRNHIGYWPVLHRAADRCSRRHRLNAPNASVDESHLSLMP